MKVELINKSSIIQIHIVSINYVAQTQRIIANTKNINKVKQNKTIKKVIQLLYLYSSYENQHDAL